MHKIMTYTPYRKLRPLIGATAALLLAGCATSDRLPYQSTFRIEPGDDSLAVVRKAAHTVPSANQLAALEREYIAFVHFGPNTFTRKEWGNGMEDPRVFDLRSLDTDQWCEGVMSSPYKDGKGDIVKELSRSCQKYGLKLGIYLSPADLYQIESPQGLYGNLSQKTRRVIPREVPGRPFANQTKFEFVVDDYNEYYLNAPELGKETLNHFLHHPDEAIAKEALGYIYDKHPITIKEFVDTIPAEETELSEIVPKLMYIYKSKVVDVMMREITDRIALAQKDNDTAELENLMKRFVRISAMKNEYSKLLKRLVL